jgi:hypothetical protein
MMKKWQKITLFHQAAGLPLCQFHRVLGRTQGWHKSSKINTTAWVGEISPRPVMLMRRGADVLVTPQCGHWLYEAASTSKRFWYEKVDHTEFDELFPDEYEERVYAFYDCHLLGDGSACTKLDTFEWEGVAQDQ